MSFLMIIEDFLALNAPSVVSRSSRVWKTLHALIYKQLIIAFFFSSSLIAEVRINFSRVSLVSPGYIGRSLEFDLCNANILTIACDACSCIYLFLQVYKWQMLDFDWLNYTVPVLQQTSI
ncbi:hypothetical protein GDO81_028199 [Engystomops pustulosus]|uniref:Uncharacterized protein n=1 Tax=Engystomops pustulosus TaxID=76066 RepID=A0AAV6YDH3_ENGPU|nr:hypothetical protein GDO81_028199 [Engystomops pustulosus]